MHEVDVVSFVSVLFAGLLAGFELGVHYGLGAPPAGLSEEAQLLLRQAMILRLRVLVPAIFFPTLLSAIAAVWIGRHHPDRGLRLAALGGLLVWILIRAIRTVPVNSVTLEWTASAPPEGWQELVGRTERYHVAAAWATVIAFGCLLLSALERG